MRSLPAGPSTLTLLFTDLVSSTELRSRLGDEQADRLRREHDDIVARAVERSDGVVVKGLGDGSMAAFVAPSAAVAAAVAIQQVIDQRNTTAPVPLALRVGLSAGEVRVEAGDVFGTAVVEAARLCAAAEAHQILMADVVRVLAGSRTSATCRPVGELDLKGLAQAVPTVDVEWATGGSSRSLPFPEIPTFERTARPVGRRLEQAAIQQALLGALGGQPGLVAVRGVAGTGKTRLVGEVARRAERDGMLVLYGRSDGTLEPHQPLVQALAHVIADLPPERATAGLGPDASPLTRLFPVLEQLLAASGDHDVDHHDALGELAGALGTWLRALAGETGALAVLDDLHRADAETLALVAALVGRSGPGRVLVVVVAQQDPGAGDPLAPIVAAARAGGQAVEELELGPLVADDVAELLDQLGVPAGPEREGTVGTVLGASGGYALYVAEVLHLLRSGGWLVPDGVRDGSPPTWRLAGAVPADAVPSGLDVLRTRLEALDPAARAVLRAAAVAGLSVDLDLLARATDADTGTVLAVLERTDGLHLTVRPPGTRRRRSFAHDAHRWLLDGEAATDAPVVHARLAGAYEERLGLRDDAALFPLARHRLAIGAADRATLDVVVRAAEVCERRLAPGAAAEWYGHALDIARRRHEHGDGEAGPGPTELEARRQRCLTAGARPAAW